jgi:hypothetical protein
MDAFTIGKAPFNFATKLPHDGWRATLPQGGQKYSFWAKSITITNVN